MGGIPWVLDLLVVNAREVQSNACAVVGVLCKSDDIVGIMTEQGLCDRLANLVRCLMMMMMMILDNVLVSK